MILDCREVTELAPAYLAGELDASRAAAMDAHLQSCPACLRELERQARRDLRLRQPAFSKGLEPPTAIWRIRERVAARSSAYAGRGFAIWPSRRRVTIGISAAAASLLLAAGYWMFRAPRIAEVCSDAANDHRIEVVNSEPRTWISDPAKIADLALRQGIPSGSVPLQVPGDYRLGRARLCVLDRRVFLHLVYSNGKQEVSLYLRPRVGAAQGSLSPNAERGTPVARASTDGAHVASFETASLTAVVVASESSDAALRFAQAVSVSL